MFGALPHTDYGFITVVAQDNAGGLNVRPPRGVRNYVPSLLHMFVISGPDLPAYPTSDRGRSALDRSQNVAGGEGHLCPHLSDMDLDDTIIRLDVCCGAGEPPRYAPMRYDDCPSIG